jgi:glucose-1-phosphate adenylyltransferase
LVRLHSYSSVQGSVLLDNVMVGRHAQIRRAIIDKNVVVPEGAQIGLDHDHDRERGFTVTDSGVVVIGKGQVITP